MKTIKRRVMELEKQQGGPKVSFLILYGGETAPEIEDPDVVIRMIMRLPGTRPEEKR